MSTPRTICAVDGCTRPTNGAPWGALCATHAARQYRHGSPHARALPDRFIREHREPIAKALARYRNSDAVRSAELVAADLLNFRVRSALSAPQRATEEQMARLRNGGVTPRDLLQRVCEIWALQARDSRFDDSRELHHALARAVLRLRPMRTWRPGGPLLRFLGNEILEELGTFAAGLCARIEHDAEVKRQAKKSWETGWTLDGKGGGEAGE